MLPGVIILSGKFRILVWEMLQMMIRINPVFFWYFNATASCHKIITGQILLAHFRISEVMFKKWDSKLDRNMSYSIVPSQQDYIILEGPFFSDEKDTELLW